jgi:hypothetical protein
VNNHKIKRLGTIQECTASWAGDGLSDRHADSAASNGDAALRCRKAHQVGSGSDIALSSPMVRSDSEATRPSEVASAEAKQSLERQGDYRSIQEQPRAPRRRAILYSFVGAVPTIIGSYALIDPPRYRHHAWPPVRNS